RPVALHHLVGDAAPQHRPALVHEAGEEGLCLVVGHSLLVGDAAVQGDVDAEGQESHAASLSHTNGPRQQTPLFGTASLRNKKAPRGRRGLLFMRQCSAYRLTWRLVPPPGAPLPGSPLETNLTHSESLSLKYEVSLAVRSASRLFCCVPEAAVVNPGSWKITQEPLSSS